MKTKQRDQKVKQNFACEEKDEFTWTCKRCFLYPLSNQD